MDDSEMRPVLVPGGNKTILVATVRKRASKPSRKLDGNGVTAREKMASSPVAERSSLVSSLSPPSAPRRHEKLLQSNLSLNASCSSDASTDSSCSRTSTGRIDRSNLTNKRRRAAPKLRKIVAKVEKTGLVSPVMLSSDFLQEKQRCAWVTPNTEPCYASFHDEEWGVPIHDDRKLFELLVFSGALAELTWPVILNKRHIFREAFLDFDPVAVSKLNEKKILALGRTAGSLLSEQKLRGIIENARQTLKIVDEFGSFDRYCWSFVNQKPVISRFRYPHQVPLKTPKAEVISKDLVRRGFCSVSPTVIYSFMQAAGLANDHLINCYRFEECVAAAMFNTGPADETKCQSCMSLEGRINSDKELAAANDLQLSRVAKLSISGFVEV